MTDWLKEKWCRLFHGGGTILRDCYGRVNWQCVSCGRWSIPVDTQTEKLMTEAALAQTDVPLIDEGKTPRKEWAGLTPDDINKSWEWSQKSSKFGWDRLETFAESLDAKLKEKNT